MLYLNLKNFWLSIRRDKFLLIALLIGLILRGINPTFGTPSLYVSNDEAIAHLSALNMIASRTPVSIANYTPLGAYVQIPFLVASFLAMKILGYVSGISDYELFVLTHEGYFLFIPRLISVLFGTLTILVIYKITLALYGEKKIGIIAAFLTAVSFNLVHISHFGRPWSAALFFFTLAIYLSLKNKTLLSYISIGLSYGFHQVGILFIPLALWLDKKRFQIGNLPNIFVMILMIALFSNLTLRVGLVESIRENQSFLQAGKLAADLIVGNNDLLDSTIRSFRENLFSYFTISILITDGVIFLFSLLGIVKTFKESLPKKLIYYMIIYFTFAILFFHPLLRYLLPIFLISIPFAAYGVVTFLQKEIVPFIIILVLSAANSIWWNYLYLKEPTFIQAHNWIDANIPRDVPIAYIGGRYQTFVPSRNAIIHVQTINKNYFKTLLPIIGYKDLDNVRNIIYASNFGGDTKLEQLKNATKKYPVRYVIDVYFDPDESIYHQNPNVFEISTRFAPTHEAQILYPPEPLFDPRLSFQFPTSKIKFSMYSLERFGPYLDILKLNND